MGKKAVNSLISRRRASANRAGLVKEIRRYARDFYVGQAREEWVRVCLRCLRNGRIRPA